MMRSALYRMYILIPCLCLPLTGPAQDAYQAVYWNYDDGLPTQTFHGDILQSPDGYLWFSAPVGIVRFDGIRFNLLNQTNSPLTGNSILTLFKDSGERWWFGIEGKGFGFFTKDTTLIFPDPSYVKTYAELPQGTLWIGTDGNGLWRMDLDAGTPLPRRAFPGETDVYINELSPGISNALHVAAGNGLYTIRGDSITAHQATRGVTVFSAWADPDGSIWYGAADGLHQLKNELSRHIAFPSPTERPLVRQVAGYRGGVLALTDHALYLYREGQLKSIFETEDHVLVSMGTDHEGGIWLGTEVSGLIQLIPSAVRSFGKEEGLPDEITTVITQSGDGTIYIGTTSGLAVLEAGSSAARTLFEGALVTSVLADRQNRIWVALRGKGVRLLEGNRIRSFTAREGLLSTAIWTFYEDEGGRIWAGGATGIATYSSRYGWQDNRVVNEKLLNRDVRTIRRTQSGTLWIGTSYGLHAFRGDTVQVYATEHGLKSALILDVAGTGDGSLWIATKDGGVHRLKDGQIEHIPESLTGTHVSRIITVGDHLWVAGSKAITGIKYGALNRWLDREGELPDPVRIDQNDGLQGEIFGTVQPGGWQMQNGELWFPTSRGVALFQPGADSLHLPPPPVALTYAIVGTDTLHDPSFLEIPHSRDRIDISYTGFSYINPDAVSYAYRLTGFDQEWNRVGNRRTAIYTNIPPGDYQFEVKARIGQGTYNRETATLPVTVIPAFYETVWFRAAAGFGILLALWGGYTYRINNLKRLERLRVRIANDLHDEIGSNLGSIVLRSRLLSQSESISGRQQQQLTEISRISRQTAVSMRDIIWLINPDKDRLDDLQYKLKQITEQLLVDVAFKFNTKGDGSREGIPLHIRRNTVFIYKEILHNILKHASAASVEIEFIIHHKELTLLVKDNGIGFHKDGDTGDGIGLTSMRQRANDMNARLQIDSAPGEGTTVRLVIPVT